MPILNPNLAFVIAHYHVNGKVPVNLLNLVKYIATLSDKIVFVSTNICESDAAKISPFAKVISRENYGYDFWSYKVGMEALGNLGEIERLVFLNSSFVTTDPEALLKTFMQPISGKALRGLTLCNQPRLHVQSYLFSFDSRELINSAEFRTWWANMIPLSDRNEVITHYEIGMSTWFSHHGVSIKSTFTPAKKVVFRKIMHIAVNRHWKRSDFLKVFKWLKVTITPDNLEFEMNNRLNPTLYFWENLYQESKILKIDLLKNNPTKQDLSKLFSNIDQTSLELIKDAIT